MGDTIFFNRIELYNIIPKCTFRVDYIQETIKSNTYNYFFINKIAMLLKTILIKYSMKMKVKVSAGTVIIPYLDMSSCYARNGYICYIIVVFYQ